ncbi:hypothetical protein DAI22_05g278550 [Oryza sativa Japonica Group]|nr:hypothetical protein DAI22_05g278550 [Oryza sativa Japonica Group]
MDSADACLRHIVLGSWTLIGMYIGSKSEGVTQSEGDHLGLMRRRGLFRLFRYTRLCLP